MSVVLVPPSMSEMPTGPVDMSAIATCSAAAGVSWSALQLHPGTGNLPLSEVQSVSLLGKAPAAHTIKDETPMSHEWPAHREREACV